MNAMGNYDWYVEFKNYCMKHMGISGMQFHYWEKMQDIIYGNVKASMTPYVPEPNNMEVTMVDIFSRMMMDRKIWLAGPVNDQMSTVAPAQLLYLSTLGNEDIEIYVDSPGGSVKSGLTIVDTMNYITPDVSTLNTGMAASMGSILLGNGAKGKRYALPNARVMLHQVSHGTQGNVQDTRINQAEAEKYNDKLFELLGGYCGKESEQVKEDASRDLWLTSEEALEYGIIDGIVTKQPTK